MRLPCACASRPAKGHVHDMETMLHEELSHGLRTPLTSVLGYSATLIDRWEHLDEDARLEFIRVVYGEALRMVQSIEAVDRCLASEFAADDARSDALKQLRELADAS